MTAQKTKPTQKRLNNCVLSPLRWAKIYEKLENCACGTLKIKDAVANAAVRVANAPKKGQARRNTTLLGKYPFTVSVTVAVDPPLKLRRIDLVGIVFQP